jgi:pilus assembly protein FimV
VETDVGLASTRTGNGAEEVDPLEEAEIFLAYGRDAQAEELLKEALQTHPARFDVHAKLLEIYAKRADVQAFENLVKQVQQGTGGEGEIWDRVVRLGYSIDPDNPRYADGKTDDDGSFDGTASQPENLTSTVDRLDFDVGFDDNDESAMAPDFDPSAASEFKSSPIVDPEATMEGSLDDAPTMKIDMGDAGLTATDLDLNAELPMLDEDSGSGSTDSHTVDFESTRIEIPDEQDRDEITQDSAMDFNMDGLSLDSGSDEETGDTAEEDTSTDMPALDLSGISLDLDGATTTQAGSAGKDEKWYEVQTKFDLAKAYQEMGDNDGAKEILQEVISEGDSEQKAAAESVLASLG